MPFFNNFKGEDGYNGTMYIPSRNGYGRVNVLTSNKVNIFASFQIASVAPDLLYTSVNLFADEICILI